MHVNKSSNWDDWIELAMFSYNTSMHEGPKYTPHELVFDCVARPPSSNPPLKENMDLTYQDYLIDLYIKLQTHKNQPEKI